mmetsp:Transcript_88404/g.270575  ORF Transcript_88404/g.270575 Transcript_88404/m.270575 type:complete len:223 (+) Transcript_88404:320-988(+)
MRSLTRVVLRSRSLFLVSASRPRSSTKAPSKDWPKPSVSSMVSDSRANVSPTRRSPSPAELLAIVAGILMSAARLSRPDSTSEVSATATKWPPLRSSHVVTAGRRSTSMTPRTEVWPSRARAARPRASCLPRTILAVFFTVEALPDCLRKASQRDARTSPRQSIFDGPSAGTCTWANSATASKYAKSRIQLSMTSRSRFTTLVSQDVSGWLWALVAVAYEAT